MFTMEVRTTEDEIKAISETHGNKILNGTAACEVFSFFTEESMEKTYKFLLDTMIHIKYQPIGAMDIIIEAMKNKYGLSTDDATLLHIMAAMVGESGFNATTLECVISGAYGMAQHSIDPEQENTQPKFSNFLNVLNCAVVADFDNNGNIINSSPLTEQKVSPEEVARRIELVRSADKASYNKVMDENFPKLQPWIRTHLDPHANVENSRMLPGSDFRCIPLQIFDVEPLQFFSIGDELYALDTASTYYKVFAETVKKFPGLDAELYIDLSNISVCDEDELQNHSKSVDYHILRLFESYGGRNKYINAFYRALCDEIAGTSISI